LDAAGKPAGGILTGTLTAFGSYDQCVAIEAKDSPDQIPKFTGRYCTVELRPPIPHKPKYYTLHDRKIIVERYNKNPSKVTGEIAEKMHFFYFLVYRYGVCVPSTCQREDVEKIASSLAKTAEFEVKVSSCEVKQDGANLNANQTTIVTMVVILTVLVLLSTAVDAVKEAMKQPNKKEHDTESFLARFTTSFSLIRSVKSVFRSNTSLGHLNAVHGLRTLSLLWFMLGHIFLFLNYQFFRNLMIAVGFAKDFPFQMIINSTLATDTLIFLNGFLFGYHGLVDHEIATKRRQPFFNTLHKAYRAAVAMLLATAVAILLPIIGSGPMWKETMDTVASNCKSNWWLNILFVNNLVVSPQDRRRCSCTVLMGCCGLVVTRRLQNNFFLQGDIFFIPSFILTICLITMGALYRIAVSVRPHHIVRDIDKFKVVSHGARRPPLGNLPFCWGLLSPLPLDADALLSRNPDVLSSLSLRPSELEGALRRIEPPASAGRGGTPPIAHRMIEDPRVCPLWAWRHLHAGDDAGIVGDFLSWSAFGPLSRLAPLVFLLHPLVQNVFTAYVRERVQADQLMALFLFCGLIVMGYLGAFLCSIIADAPLHGLEQIMCEKLGIIATAEGCPRRLLEVAKPVLKALPLPSCTKITILGEKTHSDGKPNGDCRL
ncbi:unnamed protein product, partial [Ixodes hexagonus]